MHKIIYYNIFGLFYTFFVYLHLIQYSNGKGEVPMKRLLSIFLSLVMLLSIIPMIKLDKAPITAQAYSSGQFFYFGNYPQSRVTDSTLLTNLGNVSKSWKSLRTYAGTGTYDDGKQQGTDNMEFCDFMYNGSKYRAIRINNYRPAMTDIPGRIDNTQQDENGYTKGNIYYFKYERIAWRVLDPDEGTLISNVILDAQEYQSMVYKDTSSGSAHYYRYRGSSDYASIYRLSSMSLWLTNEFLDTAFNDAQADRLIVDTITNDASDSKYASTVKTSVYLPSVAQAVTAASWSGSVSDYAKCMGYNTNLDKYWTRNATGEETAMCYKRGATNSSTAYVTTTDKGVRPVIHVDLSKGDNTTVDTSYCYSAKKSYYTVTLNKEGKGTVTGAGTKKYRWDEFVNITAEPASGYTFKCWKNSSGTEQDINKYPANWSTLRSDTQTRLSFSESSRSEMLSLSPLICSGMFTSPSASPLTNWNRFRSARLRA